jgi:tripartite-type tricarboxylate transporter receptor subunit TctC
MKLINTLMSFTAAAAFGTSAFANCGSFPARPIEVVVPYKAGGNIDIAARTLVEATKEIAGWDLRVANRTGSGTITGQDYLETQAPTDGYTIGVMPLMAAVLNDLDERNALKPGAIEVIEKIAFDPFVFVARKGESLEDLIEKGNEGKLRYAFSPGSEQGLMGKKFEEKHGFEMARVPLSGGVDRIGGLLNGSVDIAPSFYNEAQQYIEGGLLSPIGVTNDTPYWADETIPTFTTNGYDFQPDTWGAYRVILVPTGVPEDIKTCLSETFNAVLSDERATKIFGEKSLVPAPIGHEAAKAKYDDYAAVVTKLLEAEK